MPKRPAQKVLEKQCFLSVFRVRLFPQDQGARSRGPERELQECSGPRKGVLEDTFSPPGTLRIWVFPRLFSSRDSRYNTLPIGAVSPLALEGQRALLVKEPALGPPSPKERGERSGRSRLTPALLDRNRAL